MRGADEAVRLEQGEAKGETGEKVMGEMARAAALFFVSTQNC